MPLLMRKETKPEFLAEGGMPLGMLPGVTHEVCHVDLAPGDRLLIYSDGVTESGLGEEGLADACHRLGMSELSILMGALEWRLLHLRSGQPPEDDISMLAIERAEVERA